MMKKGIVWYILSIPLIGLQTMSIIGSIYNGTLPSPLSFSSFSLFLYDLIVWISYLFVGLIGILFIGIGLTCSSRKMTSETEIANGKSTEKSPVNVNTKKSKHCYCKLCGSMIEPDTKKCTGCGKQYFLNRIKLSTVILFLLAITSITIAVWSAYRANQYRYLNFEYQNKIIQLNDSIQKLEETVESKETEEQNISMPSDAKKKILPPDYLSSAYENAYESRFPSNILQRLYEANGENGDYYMFERVNRFSYSRSYKSGYKTGWLDYYDDNINHAILDKTYDVFSDKVSDIGFSDGYKSAVNALSIGGSKF